MSRKEMEKKGAEVLRFLTDYDLRFIVNLAIKFLESKEAPCEAWVDSLT